MAAVWRPEWVGAVALSIAAFLMLIVVEIVLVQSRKAAEAAEHSARFAVVWSAADHLLAVPTVTDNPFAVVPYPLRHAVSVCTFQNEPLARPGKDLAGLCSVFQQTPLELPADVCFAIADIIRSDVSVYAGWLKSSAQNPSPPPLEFPRRKELHQYAAILTNAQLGKVTPDDAVRLLDAVFREHAKMRTRIGAMPAPAAASKS